jgi:hypothetical protein
MAEHSINLGHHIQPHNTPHHHPVYQIQMHGSHCQMTEVELRRNSMNREDGVCQNKSWKPLTWSMKDWMETRDVGSPQGDAAVCTLPVPSRHSEPPPRWHGFLPPPLHPYSPLQFCNTLTWCHMLVPYSTHLCNFSIFFLDQQNCFLLKAILNFCCCLLLVHLVVMWEPSSFNVFCGKSHNHKCRGPYTKGTNN